MLILLKILENGLLLTQPKSLGFHMPKPLELSGLKHSLGYFLAGSNGVWAGYQGSTGTRLEE